jgi:hypothetical protein
LNVEVACSDVVRYAHENTASIKIPQLLDQELFTIPPLGTPYIEQWRKEDEEEARKGRSRYGYVSTRACDFRNAFTVAC